MSLLAEGESTAECPLQGPRSRRRRYLYVHVYLHWESSSASCRELQKLLFCIWFDGALGRDIICFLEMSPVISESGFRA